MKKTPLHKPLVAVSVLFVLYALSLLVLEIPALSDVVGVGAVTLLLSVPFLIPLAFLGGIEDFESYIDPIWVKASLILAGAGYAALSNSWASSVLNKEFSVGAGNFPLTQAVLTVAYVPVVIFKPIISLGYVGLIASAPAVLLLLSAFSRTFKDWIKRTVFVAAIFIYFVTLLGSYMFWENNSGLVAKKLALFLDFDEEHLCDNLTDEAIDSVVRTGGGNVVIHRKAPTVDGGTVDDFQIRKCIVGAEI